MAKTTIYHNRSRAAGLITLALVCGASLTACLGPGGGVSVDEPSGYPIFDRDQTPDDILPSDFDEIDLSEFDESSSRYSGTHDDVDYFLLRGLDSPDSSYCLATAAGEGSQIACSGPQGLTSNSYLTVEAPMMPEPAISADGWMSISDNVRVKDSE